MRENRYRLWQVFKMAFSLVIISIVVFKNDAVIAQNPSLLGYQVVPESMLQGPTLMPPDLNFSITAPDSNWIWYTKEIPKIREQHSIFFSCYSVKTDNEFLIFIDDGNTFRIDDQFMKDFLIGVKGRTERDGYTLLNEQYEPANMPIDGKSYKFYYQLIDTSGKVSYVHGYAVAARRMYVLQFISADSGTSDVFQNFVQSFKLLRPVAMVPPAFVYIAVVLLMTYLAKAVNSARKKPVFNGANIGLVFVLVLFMVRIVNIIHHGGDRIPELLGEGTGEAGVAVGLAIFLSYRFKKKQKALLTNSRNG